MKAKLNIVLAILISMALLVSCQAEPKHVGTDAKVMTESEWAANKTAIDKTEVVQAYIGTMAISGKSIAIDKEAKVISYSIENPIWISKDEIVDEIPLLSALLPNTPGFWVISGNATLSYAGYDKISAARDIDDVFKVSEMNLIIADNKEGTLNRTEISIVYQNGFGTIKINENSYSLEGLERIKEYGDSIEDLLEEFFEERVIKSNGNSLSLISFLNSINLNSPEMLSFAFDYRDAEDDEVFAFEGNASVVYESDKNSFSITLQGTLTDKERGEYFNLEDAAFSLRFSIGANGRGLKVEEATVNGTQLWDSLLDRIDL